MNTTRWMFVGASLLVAGSASADSSPPAGNAQRAACVANAPCAAFLAACRANATCTAKVIADFTAQTADRAKQAEQAAQTAALAGYKPDVFEAREVEACAMTLVLASFPVRGGRNWVFEGESETTAVACDKLPKLTATPVPRSVLRGTGMDTWRLGSDGRPETVELRNGVPHRIVSAWAIGPKAKRQTEAPCHEIDPAVICEGAEDADFVTATRQLETVVRSMERLLSEKKYAEFKAVLNLSQELTKVANEGQQEMPSSALVKTSDGGIQSKKDFETRIGRVLERVIAVTKSFIAARQPTAGK